MQACVQMSIVVERWGGPFPGIPLSNNAVAPPRLWRESAPLAGEGGLFRRGCVRRTYELENGLWNSFHRPF